MPRTIKKYDPNSTRSLNLSMYGYGLLTEWYNKGLSYTIPYERGKLLDQRVFPPAVQKGLFATDGEVWWMTDEGRDFIQKFITTTPWKSTPSLEFGKLIQNVKTIAFIHNRKRLKAQEQQAKSSQVLTLEPKSKAKSRSSFRAITNKTKQRGYTAS